VLRDVVAVVGEPVAAFELGVLAEVFGLDRTAEGLPGFDFAVCAPRPGLVNTTSGFAVHVAHGLERLATADLVAVPSWTTVDTVPPRPLVAALHAAVDRGARVLAVCSGAFLLAAAGLLDDRRAATHWRYAPVLAARYPRVRVDPEVLYVDDGPVLTSAGTAAALDACLHLIRTEFGTTVANALGRRMVVAPHRPGGQAQFVQAPVPAAVEDDRLGPLLEWAEQHLSEPLSVELLSRRALMSPRTFARRFVQATGTTPHRWLLDRRLTLAEQLLEETDLSVDQVAAHCGLGSADTLRHHFTGRRRRTPTAYRAFRTLSASHI
jgi:transcriptional regulator GlxA family with amidase domain